MYAQVAWFHKLVNGAWTANDWSQTHMQDGVSNLLVKAGYDTSVWSQTYEQVGASHLLVNSG